MQRKHEISLDLPKRFGWVIDGQNIGPEHPFDINLGRDSDFVVTPTKGALVEDWLLIIPRRRAHNFSQLPANLRVKALEMAHSQFINATEKYFIFEHGACENGSSIGCGVDQAHLHRVILSKDLLNDVRSDTTMDWFKVDLIDPWESIDLNKSYYFICTQDEAYVSYPKIDVSQFFRKRIANLLGKHGEWDYKLFPNEQNARRLVECYDRTSAAS